MIEGAKLVAVIAAGGSGLRMGTTRPKQFIPIAGIPIVARSFLAFSCVQEVDSILVVGPQDFLVDTRALIREYIPRGQEKKLIGVIGGGETRQESVRKALEFLVSRGIKNKDIILVHDAARPFVSKQVILRVAEGAAQSGLAIPGIPVKDTIRTPDKTLERPTLTAVQTPQGFRFDLGFKAHLKAKRDGFEGTDDSSIIERLGRLPKIVEGDEKNFKITTPNDLEKAGGTLTEGEDCKMRLGIGFDVHRLVQGRPLVLGGVKIDYEKGLDGHSDADVLTHAIMDALLGAAGLGDIGKLFPDSDPKYKGANSLDLLSQVGQILNDQGYVINNIDSVLAAQRPKIAPYREKMISNIAQALGLERERVSVKATTTEELGFEGRGQGMSARAICSIRRT